MYKCFYVRTVNVWDDQCGQRRESEKIQIVLGMWGLCKIEHTLPRVVCVCDTHSKGMEALLTFLFDREYSWMGRRCDVNILLMLLFRDTL